MVSPDGHPVLVYTLTHYKKHTKKYEGIKYDPAAKFLNDSVRSHL